jgi:hypothetical protein
LRDRIEQFAHAGRAVLRLLHRQRNEVVFGCVDRGGDVCGKGAGGAARIDLHEAFAPLDRHADSRALAIDQVDFRRKADQLDLVPGEQQLGRKE